MKIQLSKGAEVIISQLNNYGFEAFAVGGCVRDCVLGLIPHDWDVCTDARPEQIKNCFADFKTFDTGIKHGTISVVYDDEVYEVTTYRIDGEYTDNRHPNSVEFTANIACDLSRRDFTVNAMAYNDEKGIVDPFGGLSDTKNRVIRCVGNPDKRFSEDSLRILRALRFASVYGFDIEAETSASVKRNCELLRNIACERINTEFTKLLCGKYAESVLLEYREVFAVLISELTPIFDFELNKSHDSSDIWRNTARAVTIIDNIPLLRVTMLFNNICKYFVCSNNIAPDYSCYNNQILIAEIAEKILRRLKYPAKFIDDCLTLIKYYGTTFNGSKKQIKHLMNKIGAENTKNLIKIQSADIIAKSENMKDHRLDELNYVSRLIDEIITCGECFSLKNLAVSGYDIKSLDIKEGREVGNILTKLLDMVIDGKVKNEKAALIAEAKIIKLNTLQIN